MKKIVFVMCKWNRSRIYDFAFALSLSLYANKVSPHEIVFAHSINEINISLTAEIIILLIISICFFMIGMQISNAREKTETDKTLNKESIFDFSGSYRLNISNYKIWIIIELLTIAISFLSYLLIKMDVL
jgi:hypothetical protein